MRGLLGYRFLRWFSGDLQNRWRQSASIFDDQILESGIDRRFKPDYPASEEDGVNEINNSSEITGGVE